VWCLEASYQNTAAILNRTCSTERSQESIWMGTTSVVPNSTLKEDGIYSAFRNDLNRKQRT